MREAKWLASADPVPMLAYLGRRPRDRRYRLFALACCHRVRRFITDPRSVAALELAERYAERGVVGLRGRRTIEEAAGEVYAELDAERDRVREADPVRLAEVLVAIGGSLAAKRLVSLGDDSGLRDVSEYLASSAAFEWALQNQDPPEWNEVAMGPEKAAQAELVRCIFGNPFRPVTLDPSWLTPSVTALAQPAYDVRILPSGHLDPARLTILADALEEAGCTNAGVLGHLRGPGPHVRGCWVLDLLLEKE